MIMGAIGLSGLIAIEAVSYIAFGKSVIFSLLNAEHFNYIISSKLELIVHDRIFIFLVVYTVLILSFIKLKNKSFDFLMSYCAMIYLLYVALPLSSAVSFIVFLFFIYCRQTEKYVLFPVGTVLVGAVVFIYWEIF